MLYTTAQAGTPTQVPGYVHPSFRSDTPVCRAKAEASLHIPASFFCFTLQPVEEPPPPKPQPEVSHALDADSVMCQRTMTFKRGIGRPVHTQEGRRVENLKGSRRGLMVTSLRLLGPPVLATQSVSRGAVSVRAAVSTDSVACRRLQWTLFDAEVAAS